MCDIHFGSNANRKFSGNCCSQSQNFNPTFIKELDKIPLADPKFFENRPVDIIIGSEFYPQIIRAGVKKDILGTLIAQETVFGWILTGPVQDSHPIRRIVSYYIYVKLDRFLTKF